MMPTLDEIGLALKRAHDAGDTAGATVLAKEYKRQQDADAIRQSAADGMSTTDRVLSGVGKAFHDIGTGTGQLLREGIEAVSPAKPTISSLITGKKEQSLADRLGLPTREDIDENKRLEKPLMNTTAGTAGNIAGNVALAAPLAFIPGANTIAGGAAIGAINGAMQPVGAEESRGANAAIGGVTGAAVPAAIKMAKALKAAVIDPFTEAGRSGIAGNLLNKVASDPDSVIGRLMQARGATPGFTPTVGQAADDAGVASLERTIRATYPQGFDAVDKSQRGALVDALRSIAKTPEERAAAVTARETAVKPLYAQAKSATVMGDDAIQALLNRPSMTAAREKAAALAAERGQAFGFTPAVEAAEGVAAQPATMSGTALHDLKLGIDDAIGNAGTGGLQGAERNAALSTKEEYLKWLESKIPAYAQAKDLYSGMSRPINQMDIGTELAKRFTPAIADQGGLPFKSTAAAYANALRNGDDLARGVTGMSNPLASIMEPEQMALLKGVAQDSATKAAAEGAGRGVGSDTVQKLSMSNIAAQAGVPNWMASMARVPGGWAKRAGDVLYGDADEQIRKRLADLLIDPQAAAEAMQKAGMPPSKIAQFLQRGAQVPMLAAPASVNALEQ